MPKRYANQPSTASPPVQHHHHWFWLLGTAVLGCLIVFPPRFVLVQWGPRLFGTLLSKQLQTMVTVEGVAGGWLSGLEVWGIEVAESPAPQAPPLLRLERFTLNLAVVWLLVSSDPIVLRIEEPTVNLRRLDDEQWNVAALLAHFTKPTTSAAPTPALPPTLPHRRVDVILTGGRLHVGDAGTPYSFDLHAGSPSLAAAPLQWHFALTNTSCGLR